MPKHLFFVAALISALLIPPTSYFAAEQENPPAKAGKSTETGEKPQVEKKERGPLTDESRTALTYYVGGEFAKAGKYRLPGGNSKNGARLTVYFDKKSGKYKAKLEEAELNKEIAKNGFSIIPNDDVQITLLEVKGKTIEIVLNGGLKKKKKGAWLKDHVQVGIGSPGRTGPPIRTQTKIDDPNAKPKLADKPGSMVFLDFPNGVPDITPDELKELLTMTGILDFSNQTSAAVHEEDKWPPEIRQAVSEGRVIVGMNAEQAKAALKQSGYDDYRTEKGRNAEGRMIITRIYGEPLHGMLQLEFDEEPGENHDKVVCIKEEPNISECKQTSKPHVIKTEQ